ncbi:Oligopeptide-binding protein AppA precursor [Pseudobythopirellula maris]|uniref:Oligopeptide-binding protein AppA n=1 Tax=Pseudobythopirellula maris TaxID=2527991 RepID=A0A5C5ZVP5_9BACT|nr:ABC transporter substrate-binding protein [Pseudobythopirellula maris]TWT91128.1 Oligopeptide-binding protein AppA precursor [Pseudobythopirellula maris]
MTDRTLCVRRRPGVWSPIPLLLLATLVWSVGCGGPGGDVPGEPAASSEGETSEQPAEEPEETTEAGVSALGTELEPFDPPPLEEIDASAAWVDMPVFNARETLRERLAGEPPLVSEAEAMALRNDSDESNQKIYSVVRQLPASDEEVDYDAVFLHHVSADAKSLNPVMINSTVEFELLELTGLQLIGFDADFTPRAVGWAVESWQASEDRMYDKFVLRDDLTWSDGTPFTAHDVEFSYRTIMDPRAPIPAVRSTVEKLRWVHAYDDRTVVMFHREPLASWTENIQFPMIPKHVYEESLEDDPTLMASDHHLKHELKPVTLGPYEYASRTRGQEIVLRRRESWYMHDGEQVRDRPYLREFRYRIITDPNTTLLALKSGELQDARLTAEQWLTQTKGDDFYERNTKASGLEWTEFHIEWNTKDPIFRDARVRRAMAYAFDFDEMLQSVFYGLVEQGTGIFNPAAWMASQDVEPFVRDLDKAEDLLDEAGWDDSDGDGVRDKEIDGRLVPFEFTLITYQQPNAIKACTLLKDNLDQIGVVCNVKPVEFTVKTQLALDHKFQALMGGWGTGTDPSTLDNIFATGGGRNFSQYSNPEVDELFRQGQKEFDREKRAALYARIHEILYEDQPNLWLFYRKSLYGFDKRLRGFNFSPRDPYGVQPGLLGLWFPKE